MKTNRILGGMLAAAVVLVGFTSLGAGELRAASKDPFESRRRDAEYRNKLRLQQELAKRRAAVPTFTIPQPALRNGYNNRFYDPRFDRRFERGFDRRFDRPYNDGYVFVPGHYQVVYGRVVYVPPHWALSPR